MQENCGIPELRAHAARANSLEFGTPELKAHTAYGSPWEPIEIYGSLRKNKEHASKYNSTYGPCMKKYMYIWHNNIYAIPCYAKFSARKGANIGVRALQPPLVC